jgi:signal transduction histidine kinase
LLVRLRNSQLKLEKANQTKQQFLRFVFHEVRVPLNALGLGVEQLGDVLKSEREELEAQVALQSQLDPGGVHTQDRPSPEAAGQYASTQLLGIIKDQVATVARILNESALT